MNKIELQKKRKIRRKKSIRKNIYGLGHRPRLSIFRSNKYIYIQAIDDDTGKTIVSESSIKMNMKLNKETCNKIGEKFAKKLKEQKIDNAVFDRNGYLYSGKIKALADSIRKNGIKF